MREEDWGGEGGYHKNGPNNGEGREVSRVGSRQRPSFIWTASMWWWVGVLEGRGGGFSDIKTAAL